jgi:transcriptional regulator with XRE-family HTH domain
MSNLNVLRAETPPQQSFGPSPTLFGRVSNRDYRAAVAQTIRDLKAEKSLTNEQLAEKLGCSEGTVANAENENGNLDPVTMLNLGALFGGQQRISRILALINGSPDEPPTVADRLDRIEREAAAIRKGLA